MNHRYREDNPACCYFHPKEVLKGVCPLCLNERLLILAAKQGHGHPLIIGANSNSPSHHINLQKIFAFGALLNRHYKSDHNSNDSRDVSTGSQEDSFISIKFGSNGVASWDKGSVSKVSLGHCSRSWNTSYHDNKKESEQFAKENTSVIGHAKPRAWLRWQKSIGHFFQLIRWKTSKKGRVRYVDTKVEGVKVRKGWVRTLTKRTKE